MNTRPKFPKKWSVLPVSLALLLTAVLTAACGASGERVAAPAPAAESVAVERAEPAMTAEAGNTADDVVSEAITKAQAPRLIIYTGDMSLVVMDTRAAMQSITQVAAEQGGYVSNSNLYQYSQAPRGSVTIRVPADKYQDTLAKLRGLAMRVESENTNSQDVTEEFTDLQARKTNLEFTEAALQQLLEERQKVGKTSDILEVYRELTDIRGQIEQIEGRMRYLANQSALSTITVDLIPDVLSQPVTVAGWEPRGVAKEAVQALITALQGLSNLVIWLVIFVLPLLIIFLIPVAIAFGVIRWVWKRTRRKQPPAQKPEKPGSAG
jgi:hypothetical protein